MKYGNFKKSKTYIYANILAFITFVLIILEVIGIQIFQLCKPYKIIKTNRIEVEKYEEIY